MVLHGKHLLPDIFELLLYSFLIVVIKSMSFFGDRQSHHHHEPILPGLIQHLL